MKKLSIRRLSLHLIRPLSSFLLFSLSPLLPFSSIAQAFNDIEWYDVDSLLSVLPGKEGEERVQTLNFLAASLSFEDKTESEYYALKALGLAEELNDLEGVASACRNLGRKEFYDGNYPQALNHYQESLKIFEQKGNRRQIAQLLEDIATTHFFAGNYDETFEIINKAIHVYREKKEDGNTVGSVRDTMTIFSRLGLPYRNIGRSDISLRIYLNYLDVGKVNKFEITDMMVHHGLVAMCYYEVGKPDSALHFFRMSNNYPDANMSIRAMKHTNYLRMALIYNTLGETDTVIRLLTQSYAWFSERGYLRQSQLAARQLGEVYLALNRATDAENHFLHSESLLKEMIDRKSYYRYDSLKYIVSWGSDLYLPFPKKQVKEVINKEAIDLYDQMYRFYLGKNQLRKAMNYLVACSDAKDTLRMLARNRESIEIQTKYETERKDTEILTLYQQNELKEMQLRQNRWFLLGLGGIIILIILLAVILIRQSRLRATHEKLIIQQKLLRSQMNPHFLFNSLASIQNFMIKEKDGLAANYLSKFSKLVRNILDSSVEEVVPLNEEMTTIENYLDLQKIRFPDKFDYVIDIDPDIDPESVMVPPMLAQPFIENAIEHGIKHKVEKGKIDIRIARLSDCTIFEVEDDGVGREKAQEIIEKQDKGHKSLATKLTQERIAVLNRKSKKKITLEIIDLKDDEGNAKGTLVRFEIPC
ncbi:hypothetical protein TBC1_1261 [Lentimicrobium saccharophilum]|uniref:Signal transduction histidine kinase internal region domain-containing protein n=1 Tax=Lentimicrobium saccharophilum TaxID=1678841 RepID=A0A0S7C389_9BACT|nr:histidine kinase [Lentimicrobium saccharophilum]GAP44260.1 hypothetical protein TBC1_1261 [Lentimicrobium saccharophilum]